MRNDLQLGHSRSTGLVDVLDRVLDKGLVIAGDIKISLAEVELLTIRIRLIVCSLEKAQSIGLDWWQYDRHLSPGKHTALDENEALRREVHQLRQQLNALTSGRRPPVRTVASRRGSPPRPPKGKR